MELYVTILGIFASVALGLLILTIPAAFFIFMVRSSWVGAAVKEEKKGQLKHIPKERMIP